MGENAHIDWENYRCFLALARTGSLSAAARDLAIDHTTIGRRVAALEASLGLKLVERMPRAVRLTIEGRRIAELGQPAQEAMFAVQRVARGAARSLAGPVTITAPPAFATAVLVQLMPQLVARHPGLVPAVSGEIAAADLNRREADIALRLSRPDLPGLVIRKLRDVPFHFYAASGFALPEAEWPLIAGDGEMAAMPQQRWLADNLAGRRVVMTTNDVTSQAAAAETGIGVALLPDFAGSSRPGLQRLDSCLDTPVRELWLVIHPDLTRAPRIRAVADFLVEALAGPG
ncbi:LysR family transcriptional regulator [Rhizobium halophytocola]|uniref:DNA-binding transcriptional LysR family regulator n=1 Tax=Rhizobium halophytocola TaxID=735519 RepID=A0ABS4DSG0_9HYPH|nr:LysR family transcriptional regulator [Rhizobium halophytocola]MBP1848628.1 DNA-binding transcriptional LysR family regulator [Rhizobium halophytocola]